MICNCCAQMHIGGGLFGTPELSMKASSHYIMANLLCVYDSESNSKNMVALARGSLVGS